MNYYISDLHLNHKNVTAEGKNFDNRPFVTLDEIHEKIKENWNSRITNGDTVYILGDCIWKVTDEMIGYFAQLKGNKILIKGNHDHISDARYKQLFSEIYDYKEVSDCIHGIHYNLVLSHFPILMWNHQHRHYIHLYGHVHSETHFRSDHTMFQEAVRNLNHVYWKRDKEHFNPFYAYNVGCMMSYMDYTPRTLQEIINGYPILYSFLDSENTHKTYHYGSLDLLINKKTGESYARNRNSHL